MPNKFNDEILKSFDEGEYVSVSPYDWNDDCIREEFKDHCKSYESMDTELNADRICDWWLQKLEEQRQEIISKIIPYCNHSEECIISQFEGGEPTKDGYRQKFAGKWYKNIPDCDCGLNTILSKEKNNYF